MNRPGSSSAARIVSLTSRGSRRVGIPSSLFCCFPWVLMSQNLQPLSFPQKWHALDWKMFRRWGRAVTTYFIGMPDDVVLS